MMTWSKSHSGSSTGISESTRTASSRHQANGGDPSYSIDDTSETIEFSRWKTDSTWQTESAGDGSSLDAGSTSTDQNWRTTTSSGATGSTPTTSSGSYSSSSSWSNSTPGNDPPLPIPGGAGGFRTAMGGGLMMSLLGASGGNGINYGGGAPGSGGGNGGQGSGSSSGAQQRTWSDWASELGEVGAAGVRGLGTGLKAVTNQAVKTVGGMATLGFWEVPDVIPVNKYDLGYNVSAGFARTSAEAGAAALTLGLSATKVGTVAKVGKGLAILDSAGNVTQGGVGAADAAINRQLTMKNVGQMAGEALGIAEARQIAKGLGKVAAESGQAVKTSQKTAVSKSAGDLFEESVKDTFRKKIIQQNEKLRDSTGKVIGEIDFETSEAIVEVGISLRGKTEQLDRLAGIAQQRAKRLDVIYGPDTSPGTLASLKESLAKRWGNRVRFIPHE